MSSPFDNPILRDLFFEVYEWPEGFTNHMVTMGTGPFDEDDFDHFLREKGVEVYPAGTDLNVLVIGRTDWDEEELDKQIEVRRGKELRVYSQEMLLTCLCLFVDPYEYLQDFLNIFGEGHPALEYLKEWGFDWPTTTIVPSSGGSMVVLPIGRKLAC